MSLRYGSQIPLLNVQIIKYLSVMNIVAIWVMQKVSLKLVNGIYEYKYRL